MRPVSHVNVAPTCVKMCTTAEGATASLVCASHACGPVHRRTQTQEGEAGEGGSTPFED